MFGFGDKKAKLEKKYQRLLEESYQLSHTDRKKSDLKAAEADELRKQIDAME
ncbi:MAG: Lacal_2735 family protein [Planctomycetota bacterium]